MQNILLINPPSSRNIYQRSKVRAAIFTFPPVSLASLGAMLLERGAAVKVLDLASSPKPWEELEDTIRSFAPTDVGITMATPLFGEAAEIVRRIKNILPSTRIIGGGPHPSALPEETLRESMLDGVVIGEGEQTIVEMLTTEHPWREIRGVAFKLDGSIIRTEPSSPIADLDSLPMPAWHLFDPQRYVCSKIISRANPVASIETSRGCPFGCIYCSKAVFGHKVRFKSPERVISEIEYLLSLGFREIHIIDDLFTADLDRAKRICDLILARGLNFPWQLPNGIRVTHMDEEFLSKAARAGCYSIGLGIETGSQALLDRIHKQITLDQCQQAVKLIRKHGMEVVCFFILGLPGETRETMEATIRFAQKLNPDFAKATIMLPLPATPLFRQLETEGRLRTRDWPLYSYHFDQMIYDHWTLDDKTLRKEYHRFYRRFYFRPNYLARRLFRVIRQGNLLSYMGYFFQTWLPWVSKIKPLSMLTDRYHILTTSKRKIILENKENMK